MTAPGLLTIDLIALAENWRALAQRVAPATCAAVVKASGYGIGVEHAAPALFKAGCRIFFVAQASEGLLLRQILPQRDISVYVLNGVEPQADPRQDYVEQGLAPAIGSEDEFARWRERAPPDAPFALHVDTGMNRLGFETIAALKAATDRFGLEGARLLMSHLVSSEIPSDPLNTAQIERFGEARRLLPALPASISNSSGIFLATRPHYDMVRPGYALFGGNPTPFALNPMKVVVTLKIAIQQTRWIEAGETCGYNAQWTAKRPTRLATLLAGYADGLPRGAGATDARDGAFVEIAGRACPLVGRVSMDLSIADVTDAPEGEVGPGTLAELIGPKMPLDTFAARSGTIGYHVLTSLGLRYTRSVIGA